MSTRVHSAQGSFPDLGSGAGASRVFRSSAVAACLLLLLAAAGACSAYDSGLLKSDNSRPAPNASADSSAPARDASADSGAPARDASADSGGPVNAGDAARGSDALVLDAKADVFDARADVLDARADVLDEGGHVPVADVQLDRGSVPDDAPDGELGKDAGDAGLLCVPDPASDSGEDCCPDDPGKTRPGVCGCGEPDTDGDSDGTADCADECPHDPEKTEPGACGCGELDTDGDSDGTADCADKCPEDPDKTESGICGCGIPDDETGCVGLRDALAHRYRFDGTGTAAVDSAGGADGTVVNTELTGTGDLELAGRSTDEYVDLEDGLVSQLADATFEVWLTWNTGDTLWQRIFDFGDARSQGGELEGYTYFMLTPRAYSPEVLRVAYSETGRLDETLVNASAVLSTGTIRHVAVVVDDTNDRMALYLDGVLEGEVQFSGSLSNLNDVNNWLGRSQFTVDPDLGATLHEFRIYAAALDASQIQLSFSAGPDAAFFD